MAWTKGADSDGSPGHVSEGAVTIPAPLGLVGV